MTKKTKTALERFKALTEARIKYHNHRVIASHPLPPRKQRFHDTLLTQTLVKHMNANSAFQSAFKKLNNSEKMEFLQRYGDAQS
jgi:hypothetical protein